MQYYNHFMGIVEKIDIVEKIGIIQYIRKNYK